MAESKKNEQAQIVLGLENAELLYELYANAEAADAHFYSCQSQQYRQHMQSVYKAASISNAFSSLKTLIDAAKNAK